MKKIMLIATAVLFTGKIHSQWINSISYFPVYPTTNDTIYFYANLSFSSGNCDQHTQFDYTIGNSVYASALHCLGMLTFICSHTDTFKINPLPAGNYNFVLHVDAGALPSPCTPGINPGPTDSINFTVDPVTSINNAGFSENNFSIYPNPSDGKFELNVDEAIRNGMLVIFSLDGKEAGWGNLVKGKNIFDFTFLENGIYFGKLFSSNELIGIFKIIVAK